jgi:hypothetical protein
MSFVFVGMECDFFRYKKNFEVIVHVRFETNQGAPVIILRGYMQHTIC